MYINPETGTLYLDEGETYVHETIDPFSTNRIAVITMPNGMEIQMTRSYAHIRPSVYDHEGNLLMIEVDRITGHLTVQGIEGMNYPERIKTIKRRMVETALIKLSYMYGERAKRVMGVGGYDNTVA